MKNVISKLNIKVKQKLLGLSLVLISLFLLFALNEGTPALILIPLGTYLMLSRQIHIYKD